MEDNKQGLWQVAEEIQVGKTADNSGLPDIDAFVYDKGTLIIRLPSVSTMAYNPPDNIYRVLVKWDNADLYFFPPYGVRWESFASWEKDKFVMKGINKIKVFKKKNENEIAVFNKDLLRTNRDLWKYDRDIPGNIF